MSLRKRIVSVRLTERQFEDLSAIAHRDHRSVSNVLQLALERFLSTVADPAAEMARLKKLLAGAKQR